MSFLDISSTSNCVVTFVCLFVFLIHYYGGKNKECEELGVETRIRKDTRTKRTIVVSRKWTGVSG